jgi:hypothetical protein
MLKIILLASVILVGLASCSVEEESTSDFVSDRGSWPLDPGTFLCVKILMICLGMFKSYMAQYNKNYVSLEEHNIRFQNFQVIYLGLIIILIYGKKITLWKL